MVSRVFYPSNREAIMSESSMIAIMFTSIAASITTLGVLFGGDPDLMDAIINWIARL